MIAKLIVHAPTRTEAAAKLERALRSFHVAGVPNNIDFLIKCCRHPGFVDTQPTTAFFEHHLAGILDTLNVAPSADHTALAASALVRTRAHIGDGAGPWGSGGDWRLYGATKRSLALTAGTAIDHEEIAPYAVTVARDGSIAIAGSDGTSTSSLDNSKIVSLDTTGCAYDVSTLVEGRKVAGTVALTTQANGNITVDVWLKGAYGDDATHAVFTVPKANYSSSAGGSGRPVVMAPMPGKVIKLVSPPGSTVKAGDPIIILEAMKMEHVVSAPCDGEVAFFCEEGASITDGTKLAEIMVAEDEKKTA
jgi:3-methylcrotonyl-CoA carboxylase alpha subunit